MIFTGVSPERPTYAVARWSDDLGTTYEWPQGLKDNRRSRVLARIKRFGMPCDPTTLTITKVEPPCPECGPDAHEYWCSQTPQSARDAFAAAEKQMIAEGLMKAPGRGED